MDVNSIVGTVKQSGLRASALHIVQENGSSSPAIESTGVCSCTCRTAKRFGIMHSAYILSYMSKHYCCEGFNITIKQTYNNSNTRNNNKISNSNHFERSPVVCRPHLHPLFPRDHHTLFPMLCCCTPPHGPGWHRLQYPPT